MASTSVSAVIPAYNQGKYLAAAIRSVLAQTRPAGEIIVVDDGSTDSTPDVARAFGDAIRYIRQENQGLAGARNTGIQAATGEFLGLLDSDDEWRPQYLETVLALAERYPQAAGYYCRARCMDADGLDLPQMAGYRPVAPGGFYQALLRGNFLLPSATLLRRSAVMEVGLFAMGYPGVEDWDLWIRMARSYTFVGTSICMVRYRLHPASWSATPANKERVVQEIIEKHFGPDDGRYSEWTQDRRRAYGGFYRNRIMYALMRERDWQPCGPRLQKALSADPSLATDLDLFYELALGTQPMGQRGTRSGLDLAGNAARLEALLGQVFDTREVSFPPYLRAQAFGAAYTALGLAAYNTGQFALSRAFLVRAVRARPALLIDRKFGATMLRDVIASLPGAPRVLRSS